MTNEQALQQLYAASRIAPLRAEQCAVWTDDDKFAEVLAVNAGFELPTE